MHYDGKLPWRAAEALALADGLQPDQAGKTCGGPYLDGQLESIQRTEKRGGEIVFDDGPYGKGY